MRNLKIVSFLIFKSNLVRCFLNIFLQALSILDDTKEKLLKNTFDKRKKKRNKEVVCFSCNVQQYYEWHCQSWAWIKIFIVWQKFHIYFYISFRSYVWSSWAVLWIFLYYFLVCILFYFQTIVWFANKINFYAYSFGSTWMFLKFYFIISTTSSIPNILLLFIFFLHFFKKA